MKKNIVLIGPFPPPIGGVSVHLQRLIHLLDNKVSFAFIDESRRKKKDIYNLRSFNLLGYFKIVKKADVVHIHSGPFVLRFFHIVICRLLLKKYTVVTIHFDPGFGSLMGITKLLLSFCNHSILVSENGYERMKTTSACKYHMIPAFLPPDINRELELPKDVLSWLCQKRQEGKIICISNAQSIRFYNNQDLYGLDICIEAFKLLDNDFCLVYVISDSGPNSSIIQEYKKRIENYGLSDKILIWENALSFIRLICEAKIVLRTTNTDGDSLTIREALYFNKIVVASDVVNRPDGVLIFKNRNVEDLALAIKKAKNNNSPKTGNIDYLSLYNDIYEI